MGCWNGTCGITQLPILAGDDVVLFFIGQPKIDESAAGGFCYSTGLWAPMSLPFYGKYNDYGMVEGIPEDWHASYFLDLLRQHVVEREQGENPYHEQAVKAADLNDVDTVQKLIRKGRIRCAVPPIYRAGSSHLVGFMMVHQYAFNFMTEMCESWRGDMTLADVIEKGRAFYVAAIAAAADDDLRDIIPMSMRLRFSSSERANNPFFALSDIATDGFSGYAVAFGIREHVEHLVGMAEAGMPIEQAEPLIERIAQFYMFGVNMLPLRRSWAPQGGAGSQSAAMKMARDLAERTIAHIDLRRDDWDPDYQDPDYDDDDDGGDAA